jgi:hypothetical protein
MHMHAWCLAQAGRPGLRVVDPWPLMVDRRSIEGHALVGQLYDGRHGGIPGALNTAMKIWEQLEPIFAPISYSSNSPADVYHHSYNPRGNLAPSGMFLGGGGTFLHSSGEAVGTLADMTHAQIPAGLKATFTADVSYLGENWQQLTIEGQPVEDSELWIAQFPKVEDFSAGDMLQASVEIAYDAGNKNALPMELRHGYVFPNTGIEYGYAGRIGATALFDYLPMVGLRGLALAPDWRLTAAPQTAEISLIVPVVGDVPIAATIYFRALTLRKISFDLEEAA